MRRKSGSKTTACFDWQLDVIARRRLGWQLRFSFIQKALSFEWLKWRLPSPLWLLQPSFLLPVPPTTIMLSFLLLLLSLQTLVSDSLTTNVNMCLPHQPVSLLSLWLLLSPVANPRKVSLSLSMVLYNTVSLYI